MIPIMVMTDSVHKTERTHSSLLFLFLRPPRRTQLFSTFIEPKKYSIGKQYGLTLSFKYYIEPKIYSVPKLREELKL